MTKNKYTIIMVVLAVILTSGACDQRKNKKLAQELPQTTAQHQTKVEKLASQKPMAAAEQKSYQPEYAKPEDTKDEAHSPQPKPPSAGPGGDFPPNYDEQEIAPPLEEDVVEDDAFGPDSPWVGPAPFPVCGNCIVEPTEQCDDCNVDNQDGCNVLCLFPICGNGLLEKFEECDDNNTTSGDGCSMDCLIERCGNKIVEKGNGEQCDDGNREPGDGCSPCCLFEKCGNCIIDPDEGCDDCNTTGGDGCSEFCNDEDDHEDEIKPSPTVAEDNP